jgi:hypothetical protein
MINEKEIIEKNMIEFLKIWHNISQIRKFINNFKENSNTFGKKTSKFTKKNYIDSYKNTIIENKNYQLIFRDESVISFFYEFDNNNQIVSYSLSYIPGIHEEIAIEEYDYNDVKELLESSYKDYIRIDLEEKGYKEILHTKNHFHYRISEDDENTPRKDIRMPLSQILYPLDFIYIICKYIYHIEEKKLEKVTELIKKYNIQRRETLSQLEKTKLFMKFNEN